MMRPDQYDSVRLMGVSRSAAQIHRRQTAWYLVGLICVFLVGLLIFEIVEHWSPLPREQSVVVGSGTALCQFGSVTTTPGPDGLCWWQQGGVEKDRFVRRREP
jgi:hypothetical protein